MHTRQDRLKRYFSGRAPLYELLYADKAGALARSWWRPMLAYYRHTRESLRDLSGKTVLEIGCGTGWLAAEMARLGAVVYAIDLCPEMIESARRTAASAGLEGRIHFELADFDTWQPFCPWRFDYVIAIAVFDYCPAPERWLKTISALGDQAIMTIPAPPVWLYMLRRLFYAVYGGVPLRAYTKSGIGDLFRAAGLELRAVRTFGSTRWIRAGWR